MRCKLKGRNDSGEQSPLPQFESAVPQSSRGDHGGIVAAAKSAHRWSGAMIMDGAGKPLKRSLVL
jgi:hypothetical protein